MVFLICFVASWSSITGIRMSIQKVGLPFLESLQTL